MRRLSQLCSLLLAAVTMLAVTSGVAEARRGGRIGIPIPSFSKGESVVKVLELPEGPAFTDPKGRHVDLGYYWPTNGEGQWVGMVSETTYYKWSPESVQKALRLAKFTALPPVPERPTDLSGVGGWGGIFWLGVIGIGVLFMLFRRRVGGTTTPADGSPVTSQPREDDAWVKRAETSFVPTVARSPVSAGPALRSPRSAKMTGATMAGSAPRAAFGRR